MSLADRTAVVTGAAQGIGRAVARRLGEAGAAVVLAVVRSEAVAETAAALAADVEALATAPSSPSGDERTPTVHGTGYRLTPSGPTVRP